jgi:omega-amidase
MNDSDPAPDQQPMPDLRVALVQTQLLWEQPEANCRQLTTQLQRQELDADLVVLPEVFNSGFSMNVAQTAQTMRGPSVTWLQQSAQALQAALCGSLAIIEDGQVFNRFIMACPDGALHYYDKRHLFRMGGEHQRYSPGQQRCIWTWQGWRLCPMVCYDLRFPVWSRNRNDFDALIYVANWPAKRRLHWRHLLLARAIENQCAVIGVNRLGVDGKQIEYCGDSQVVDAQGALLCDMKTTEGVQHCRIDAASQQRYRQSFPAALDADEFSLHL